MDEYEKLWDIYKPLFELMVDEYNKVLSYKQMDELIKAANQVTENKNQSSK